MFKSNIIAGSNIFHTNKDDPRHDREYVSQIVDYAKITHIRDRRLVDPRIIEISPSQEEIIKTEYRCKNAKNDPCWGYKKSLNKVVCACINEHCPYIKECNKNFSPEEAKYWKNLKSEMLMYGNPNDRSMHPVYYKVDIVSDEEMLNYDVYPQNEGIEFTMIKEPILKDQPVSEHKPNYRIDPLTKRKMIVIGYRWVITDTANYETEILEEIWGYADEHTDAIPIQRAIVKPIEKIKVVPANSIISKNSLSQENETDYTSECRLLETQIKSIVSSHITIADFESFDYSEKSLIVLDNPAELAYLSSVLTRYEIEHGFSDEDSVQLILLNNLEGAKEHKKCYASNTVLSKNCHPQLIKQWTVMSSLPQIIQLDIPHKEYYRLKYGDKKSRWCCRSCYGITHICVRSSDICFNENNSAFTGLVKIEYRNGTYEILDNQNKNLGKMSSEFDTIIQKMIDTNEISGKPAIITGITIVKQAGKTTIKGIGNLKFDEY